MLNGGCDEITTETGMQRNSIDSAIAGNLTDRVLANRRGNGDRDT